MTRRDGLRFWGAGESAACGAARLTEGAPSGGHRSTQRAQCHPRTPRGILSAVQRDRPAGAAAFAPRRTRIPPQAALPSLLPSAALTAALRACAGAAQPLRRRHYGPCADRTPQGRRSLRPPPRHRPRRSLGTPLFRSTTLCRSSVRAQPQANSRAGASLTPAWLRGCVIALRPPAPPALRSRNRTSRDSGGGGGRAATSDETRGAATRRGRSQNPRCGRFGDTERTLALGWLGGVALRMLVGLLPPC